MAVSEFDNVLDSNKGINYETHKILREAGMWYAVPDYHTQKIKLLVNFFVSDPGDD